MSYEGILVEAKTHPLSWSYQEWVLRGKPYICPCELEPEHATKGRFTEATLDVVKMRKEKGCLRCALIYDGICLFRDDWTQPSDPDLCDSEIKVTSWGEGEAIQASVGLFDNTRCFSYKFIVMAGEQPDFSDQRAHANAITDTTSSSGDIRQCNKNVLKYPNTGAGFECVRGWLKQCEETHDACRNAGSTLPKRVIDVGTLVGGQEIHLYESKEAEQQPYTALSHCWGPPALQPLRTLKENLADRKTRIRWDSLTKTFQDAILISQHLGIKYLWIDSLCIVQDDEDDWEEQSGRMHQVYEGAYLTIAATRAHSGIDGCFATRSCCQEVRENIVVRRMLSHRQWIASYASIFYDFLANSKASETNDTEPLLLRGWCFQERFLSTRMLHYATEEMVWECKTTFDCECGDFIDENYNGKQPAFKSDFAANCDWGGVVERYTKTKITRDTDILEALAGVAAKAAEKNGRHYLAGLWIEDFPKNLLWMSRNCGRSYHRPPSYTAPTFSWASRIGPVSLREQRYTLGPPNDDKRVYLVSLIKASCSTKPQNPFGRVSSGFLRLRARLLAASLKTSPTETKPSVRLDASKVGAGSITDKDQSLSLEARFAKTFASKVELDTEEYWGQNVILQAVFCMPVRMTNTSILASRSSTSAVSSSRISPFDNPTPEYIKSRDCACLLLVGNPDGTYKRIGIVFLGDFPTKEDLDRLAPEVEICIV